MGKPAGGAKPAGGRLSEEFRRVYEAAGFTQTELAEKLGNDQATISEWARGVTLPRVTALPMVEALCGVPKGTILRRAGYVDDIDPDDFVATVKVAPYLDRHERQVIVGIYEVARKRSVSATR